MAIRFRTFGPFKFDLSHQASFKSLLGNFRDAREKDGSPAGLCDAIGVYVWTTRLNKASTPWNVGKTDKQGFLKRFEQKEPTLWRIRNRCNGQTMEVFLIALMSPSGRFRKPTKSLQQMSANEMLESMLIGSAQAVNPEFLNISKTRFQKETVVDGYLNDDGSDPTEAARAFSALFKKSR